MPDPNSHAEDMKSLVKHETMPSLWWLTPWTFAVQQWNARAKLYARCQDLTDDLATARQDAANFSDHAIYHEQRYADQSHELKATNEALDNYRKAWSLPADRIKTYVYERPTAKPKAKRKPAPKAKTAKAKKGRRHA
jgi:hypothetical protein